MKIEEHWTSLTETLGFMSFSKIEYELAGLHRELVRLVTIRVAACGPVSGEQNLSAFYSLYSWEHGH